MAQLINLQTFTDKRGNLTVIEKIIPFDIRRVFYIYGVDSSIRGQHRHKKTIQAAISIQGSCRIFIDNNVKEEEFVLDSPSKCLILNPEDWHLMDSFTPDCILMVFASEYYLKEDYIFERYMKNPS
jgi:hypothetical protein